MQAAAARVPVLAIVFASIGLLLAIGTGIAATATTSTRSDDQ
jgi:hypothetical protein